MLAEDLNEALAMAGLPPLSEEAVTMIENKEAMGWTAPEVVTLLKNTREFNSDLAADPPPLAALLKALKNIERLEEAVRRRLAER